MFAMRRRLQQRPNRISPGKHRGPFTRKILLDVSVRQMCTCRVTLPYNLAISLCVILCHLTSPVQLRLERIWRRQAAAPAAAEGDVARHRPRLRVDDLVPAEGIPTGSEFLHLTKIQNSIYFFDFVVILSMHGKQRTGHFSNKI